MTPKLHGRSIKVVVSLDPAEVAALDGTGQRIAMQIDVKGRMLRAEVNGKSLRKVIAQINEHGIDSAFAILQGTLVGERIEDCGITGGAKNKPAQVADAKAA